MNDMYIVVRQKFSLLKESLTCRSMVVVGLGVSLLLKDSPSTPDEGTVGMLTKYWSGLSSC